MKSSSSKRFCTRTKIKKNTSCRYSCINETCHAQIPDLLRYLEFMHYRQASHKHTPNCLSNLMFTHFRNHIFCIYIFYHIPITLIMFWKTLTYLGLVSLLHAAFSAAQHKSYRRLVRQEVQVSDVTSTINSDDSIIVNFFTTTATNLPLDIVLQTIISALVVLASLVARSGEFKEIRTLDDLNRKPSTLWENQPSLYVFNHRGRLLQ